MALCELWCTQCNELHEGDEANEVTSKSIKPGEKVWVKKVERRLFLPVQKIPNKQSKMFGKKKVGKIFKKKKASPIKKVDDDSIIETSKWQLVPVLSRCKSHITVQMSTGFKVIDLDNNNGCMPANKTSVEDMTALHYTHQPAILDNLKKRALKKKPYTFIGNVLVSINPLRDVDSLMELDDLNNMPPHPRTVAERAFQKMMFSATQNKRLQEADEERKRTTKLAPSKKSLQNANSNFAQQFGLVNQSIVISGESGSGKTEASKRVLTHLVQREGYGNEFSDEDDPGVFDFQDNLIGTDPILESFGNAKTKRNPNSSRFGKFLQLKYDRYDGLEAEFFIDEASITTYLLERSRVTYQEPGEGNFRIFYQMLTAPNEKIHEHLALDQAGLQFRYLNNKFDRKDHDRIGYRDFRIALKMVKMRIRALSLFEIVAAVLHIGNINFKEVDTDAGKVAAIDDIFKDKIVPKKKGTKILRKGRGASFLGGRAGGMVDRLRKETMLSGKQRKETMVSVMSDSQETKKTFVRRPDGAVKIKKEYSPLRSATKMLRVKEYRLFEKMLLETSVKVAKEKVTVPVTKEKAIKRRDAVAKHIYGLLFEWIVEKLNETLRKPADGDNTPKPFIGILDVFGFEEFKTNSFEQLLINYTNEVLLSLFAKEVLLGESILYKEEGLVLQEKELPDVSEATKGYNEILNLFEGYKLGGRSFAGIFGTINTQQKVPQPSDQKLLSQLHKSFKAHPNFLKVHPSKIDKQFIIKHYASCVTYDIENFLQKNDQSVPPDIEDLFLNSTHKIVRKFPSLFVPASERASTSAKEKPSAEPKRMTNVKRKDKGKKGRRSVKRRRSAERGKAKVKNETVCANFSKQINQLRTTLSKTSCSYIRCVKPNPTLTPPAETLKVAGDLEKSDSRQAARLKVTKTRQIAMRGLQQRKITFASSKKKKAPRVYFDDDYISTQLKNLGVYECVSVLKSGLPTRIPYPTFLQTFSGKIDFNKLVFFKNKSTEYRHRTFVTILMKMFLPKAEYKLGRTRIFFKSGQLENVKDILDRGGGMAKIGEKSSSKGTNRIEKRYNKFCCKKLWTLALTKARAIKYFSDDLTTIKNVLLLQRNVRKFLASSKIKTDILRHNALITVQCFWRKCAAKAVFIHLVSEKMKASVAQRNSLLSDGIDTRMTYSAEEETVMGNATMIEGTVIDDEDEDDEDYGALGIVVGEHNALRATMVSYFHRRTSYNRKTNALGNRMGTMISMAERSRAPTVVETKIKAVKRKGNKKKGKKDKISEETDGSKSPFFEAHREDTRWSDIEEDLAQFDGEDADLRIYPGAETVVPVDEIDEDDISDYDYYDEIYDEDEEEGEDGSYQAGNTFKDSKTNSDDAGGTFGDQKTSIGGTYKTEPGAEITETLKSKTRRSGITSNRISTKGDLMKSNLFRSNLTRKQRERIESNASGSRHRRGTDARSKPPSRLVIPVRKKIKPPVRTRVASSLTAPYAKPQRTVAPRNRLNPKTNNSYWKNRDTKPGKPMAPWQKMKLKKVVRPNLERNDSINSTNVDVDLSQSGIAARMANKFGGSMKRPKKT